MTSPSVPVVTLNRVPCAAYAGLRPHKRLVRCCAALRVPAAEPSEAPIEMVRAEELAEHRVFRPASHRAYQVAKVLQLVIAFVLFKVLAHEARRYRETSPDLPPSLRL